MCEEVADEVNFCDDVGASVFEGAELAFVDELIHVIFAEGRPSVHLTRAHYVGRALRKMAKIKSDIPHPPPKQGSIHASECFLFSQKNYVVLEETSKI